MHDGSTHDGRQPAGTIFLASDPYMQPAPETTVSMDAAAVRMPLCAASGDPGFFSRRERWIVPKSHLLPSIFCALCAKIRLEALEDVQDPVCVTCGDVERILRDGLGFRSDLLRWHEVRSVGAGEGALDLIAALDGPPLQVYQRGSTVNLSQWGVRATFLRIMETRGDLDQSRIGSLAVHFEGCCDSDAIALELPRIWVVPATRCHAAVHSIELGYESGWRQFFGLFGVITSAHVIFDIPQHECSEPMVRVVVQYENREGLKMCVAILRDRYLRYPMYSGLPILQPPCCQLVNLKEFKSQLRVEVACGACFRGRTRSGSGSRSRERSRSRGRGRRRESELGTGARPRDHCASDKKLCRVPGRCRLHGQTLPRLRPRQGEGQGCR